MPALSDIEENAHEQEDFSSAVMDDEEMNAYPPATTKKPKSRKGRQGKKDDMAPVPIARLETCAVGVVRRFTLLALFLVSLATTGLVFMYARRQETEDFEQAFAYDASQMISTYRINAGQRLKSLESFSESITQHVLSLQRLDDENVDNATATTFPFVTVPEFERRAAYTLESSEVLGLIFHPMVQTNQRSAWETYSVANQDWLTESLRYQAIQKGSDPNVAAMIRANPVPSMITAINEDTGFPMIEDRPGPYFVLWQTAPALDNSAIINFDSYTIFQDEMDAVVSTKRPVMSTVQEVGSDSTLSTEGDQPTGQFTSGTNFLLESFLAKAEESNDNMDMSSGGGLTSVLNIPVFDTWTTGGRQVAGVLMVLVYWQRYLDNLVPKVNESLVGSSMVAVLESTCDQAYTFELSGPVAHLLGRGDLHESAFDHLFRESGYDAIISSNKADALPGECGYNLRIYPTSEMEQLYLTDEPYYFAGIIFLAFVFTALVFWCYDCFVACRHRKVSSKAVESTAVVSSLFPAAVRDEVVNIVEKYNEERFNGSKGSQSAWKGTPKSPGSYSRNNFEKLAAELDKSKPVANLYKDCTVLFCDIAGFTAWSSKRSPSQVFKLLEAIYGAFDEIATRRNVFKVETIGDCYVAVTGLPHPQTNHALIMARFANDCMTALSAMMHVLVAKLGDDTANLTMRFGLHSGHVTAGVLRGQRARFQLFGDTVNTASRMESLGQKGRIQVSQATADLLVKAGKPHWVTPRDDKIEAKGKGLLQTYWVNVTSSTTSTTMSSVTTASSLPPESPRTPSSPRKVVVIPQTISTAKHSKAVPPRVPKVSSSVSPKTAPVAVDADASEPHVDPPEALPSPRRAPRRVSWTTDTGDTSTIQSSTFDPFDVTNDQLVQLSLQQHQEYKDILEKIRYEEI